MTAKTNRLAQETSPYLLQHAHNPVDWHPWGKEAFEREGVEALLGDAQGGGGGEHRQGTGEGPHAEPFEEEGAADGEECTIMK